jgi:hypothetical protein
MTILDDTPTTAPPTGRLRIMDRSGDAAFSWGVGNVAEETVAREAFDRYRGKGYLAYRVEGDGRGEVMREFDPTAGEVVMSPQLVGG